MKKISEKAAMKYVTVIVFIMMAFIMSITVTSVSTARQEIERLEKESNIYKGLRLDAEKEIENLYDNIYRMKNGEAYHIEIFHNNECITYEDEDTLVTKIKKTIKEKTDK